MVMPFWATVSPFIEVELVWLPMDVTQEIYDAIIQKLSEAGIRRCNPGRSSLVGRHIPI